MRDSYKANIRITKTDLQKIIAYLGDAGKLYEALPMQKCKNRAYMIRQLIEKIQSKLND